MENRIVNIDELELFESGQPRELKLFGYTYSLELNADIAFDILEHLDSFSRDTGKSTREEYEVIDFILLKFFQSQNKDFTPALLTELRKSFVKYTNTTKAIIGAVMAQCGQVVGHAEIEQSIYPAKAKNKKKETSKK